MNVKRSKILTVFGVSVIILSGCSQVSNFSPSSTASPEAIRTYASSATPKPTETQIPTSTNIPPTPTVRSPDLLMDFLTNVQVISTDKFDNLNKWDTWNSQTGKVLNGMFILEGQKDYESGLVFKEKISEGYGVVVKYKTINNSDYQSEFVLNTGEWQTNSFRQFGIYNGKSPKADLMQGMNWIGGNNLHGSLSLKADTWYNLLVAVGKNGEFLTVIWNPDDPTQKSIYREKLGEKWVGLSFEFIAKANIGETMHIDDFLKIKFDEIN